MTDETLALRERFHAALNHPGIAVECGYDACTTLAAQTAAVRAELLAGSGVVCGYDQCEYPADHTVHHHGDTEDPHVSSLGCHPFQPATPPTPAKTRAGSGVVGDRGHRPNADGHCIEPGCQYHIAATPPTPALTAARLAEALHEHLRSCFIPTHIDPDAFTDPDARRSVHDDRAWLMRKASAILAALATPEEATR